MKIQNKKKSTKKTLLINGVVLVLAIGGYTALAYSQEIWPFTTEEEATDNTTQSDTGNPTNKNDTSSTPKEEDDDHTTDTSEEEGKTPVQHNQDESSDTDATALSGVINYKNITNGKLQIRATINQLLASGTCYLTLTKGTSKVTKTAEVVANPSSSTCKGFSISTSELSSGTWSISLRVVSGDKSGVLKDTVQL